MDFGSKPSQEDSYSFKSNVLPLAVDGLDLIYHNNILAFKVSKFHIGSQVMQSAK